MKSNKLRWTSFLGVVFVLSILQNGTADNKVTTSLDRLAGDGINPIHLTQVSKPDSFHDRRYEPCLLPSDKHLILEPMEERDEQQNMKPLIVPVMLTTALLSLLVECLKLLQIVME